MKLKVSLIIALVAFSIPSHALKNQLNSHNLKNMRSIDWVKHASNADVEPNVLYAIALKESGKLYNNKFLPSEYAIGIGVDKSIGQMKHVSLYPKDKAEAKAVLTQLISTGYKNIGIGMMQISWIYHNDKVKSALDLLDIDVNLEVAGKILKGCKKRNKTSLGTLSCYSYGEGDDPNGLIYADEAIGYANTYGTTFLSQLIPKGPPVGELNETFLASYWRNIEAKTIQSDKKKGEL